MTEKRFTVEKNDKWIAILDKGETIGNTYHVCALLNSLSKENEQLQQIMQEVCELLEKEVDLFSDKATEHDIIAYRELYKLDNKDAYYIATATKKAIKLLKGDVE